MLLPHHMRVRPFRKGWTPPRPDCAAAAEITLSYRGYHAPLHRSLCRRRHRRRSSCRRCTRARRAGYYVIRWENTGICQIWNEDLKYKPLEWPSHYKVVSKTVPTFSDAMATQLKMREQRHCNL
jgi:hypothetical protein